MKSRSSPEKPPKPEAMEAARRLPEDSGPDPVMRPILAALRGLELGSVEIVVHEGRITYIERREQERVSLACPPVDPERPAGKPVQQP